MIYFGIVTYYFCFILTDAYEPRTGFTNGSRFALSLRLMILALTGYQLLIEALSIRYKLWKGFYGDDEDFKELKTELRKFSRLSRVFMLFLNVWIIIEHSTNFTGVNPTRLA